MTTEEYYLADAFGKTVAIKNLQNGDWEYYASTNERDARLKPGTTNGARFSEEEAQFFVYDHLGNTRITYTPMQVAGTYTINRIDYVADYFPYGKVLREFVYDEQEKYLTTQHERDQETGLDYRGARYYDSDIARFLSVDPLAVQFVNWSTYNYVMSNPIILIDPTGRQAEDWVKNIETGKVEHKKEVTSNETTPEGYEYLFKSGYGPGEDGSRTHYNENGTKEYVNNTMYVNIHSHKLSSFDQFKIGQSTFGLVNDLATFSWESTSNKSKWKIAYDVQKHLKSSGYKVKTGTLKNGTSKVLKQAGKGLAIASAAVTVGEVLYNRNIKASNVLDATMTGVSFVPVVGWAASGIYFFADVITQEVTGKSIGGHLDGVIDNNYGTKNGVLVDW